MLTFEAALQYLEDNTDVLKMQYVRKVGDTGMWSIYACKCNEDKDSVDCKAEVTHDWNTEEDDIVEVLHKIVISTQEAFQMAEEDLDSNEIKQ